MRLVPVTGVLKAIDQVEEQDPGAARMFAQLALFEVMRDESEQAWAEIGPTVLGNMEDTVAKARTTLLRRTVGKALEGQSAELDPGTVSGLAILDEHISKADGLVGAALSMFNQQHPRDNKGRFIRTNNAAPSGSKPRTEQLHDADKETIRHLGEWRNAGLVGDDTAVNLHYRQVDDSGRPIGSEQRKEVKAKDLEQEMFRLHGAYQGDGREVRVTGLSARRGDLNLRDAKQRAAFDMIQAATGADAPTARRLMRGLPMDEEGRARSASEADQAARDWNSPTTTRGSDVDRQSFRRMQMAGRTLSSMSAPGSTMNTVGGMAQLIGDLGPEAEKVLGPGIRRTAYRYRGTERRPDRGMFRDVMTASVAAEQLTSGDVKAIESAMNQLTMDSQPRDPRTRQRRDADALRLPGVGAYWAQRSQRGNYSADQIALGMRGDTAVTHLLSALPDRETTELSVAAGELPPSQGVIIDAQGRVASQSQGYNGDHYLPFDLKNLSRLQGGQYVRTRAAGGPTTEDIYTGLMTGARQVQVVSNSGVFTVEFDPDVRGGRRYSDRAVRMIDRYGKLLSAVEGGDLYLRDLPNDVKADLRRQAIQVAGGDEQRAQEMYRERLQYERYTQSMSEEEEAELEEAAYNYAQARLEQVDSDRQSQGEGKLGRAERSQQRRELMQEYRIRQSEAKPRKLRLDGAGYDRALQSLKQEFPYYIRQASYQSLPDWLNSRGQEVPRGLRASHQADPGYTQPGQVQARSTYAAGGYQVPRRGAAARAEQQETQPAAQQQSLGSTPGQREGGTEARAPQTAAGATQRKQTLSQAASADNKPYAQSVQRDVQQTAQIFRSVAPAVTLDLEDSEDEAAHLGGLPYAHYRWNKTLEAANGNSVEAARQFTKWLLSEDTKELHRAKLLDGLEQLPSLLDTLDPPVPGVDSEQVREHVHSLRELLGLRSVFAEPSPDGAFAVPSQESPKPQPFDDILNSADPADYEQELKRLDYGADTKPIAQFVAAFERDNYTPDDMADTVRQLQERVDAKPTDRQLQQQVKAAHKAWAFRTGWEAARRLQKFGGSAAGGADPKVEKAAGRRKLIFHESGDEFSKRLLAAMSARSS